jgi:predicted glycosyl hydrolase (DUF1957 family)
MLNEKRDKLYNAMDKLAYALIDAFLTYESARGANFLLTYFDLFSKHETVTLVTSIAIAVVLNLFVINSKVSNVK